MKLDGNRLESLQNIELFSLLSRDELQQVTEKMTVKIFRRGEVILYEEDANEFMYVILEGEVRVIQSTEDGKEIILAIHKTGDFFGELSLIDGKTEPATVVAKKQSVTAIISKNDFFFLIFNQPNVLKKLLLILCSRFRESFGTIQMLNFNNALQRIKMLFLMLAEKYGKEESGLKVLNIKLTHQDLSEMAGMTRETVTRVLDKLQKDGEITILKDKLIILTRVFFENDLIMRGVGP
jgi:CRP/FNR family transcriptional regulator